jgi:hypothetical protein
VRTIALLGLLATAVAVAASQPYRPPSPDVKDVVVTLSVPKEVRLTPAQHPGGPVATVAVTVTIKNTSPWPVPFGRHYLKAPAIILMSDRGWHLRLYRIRWEDEPPRKDPRAFAINPGQTYTTIERYTFTECDGQPRKGEPFTVRLKVYGHEVTSTFNFH